MQQRTGTSGLSQGSIRAIMTGGQVQQPHLQILKIEETPTGGGPAAPKRYRMHVSDGLNSTVAMLTTGLNNLVNENKLRAWCIVEVKTFQVTTPQGKDFQIVIITDLEVKSWPTAQIGNPQFLQLRPPQQQQQQQSPLRAQPGGNQGRPPQQHQQHHGGGAKPSPQRPPPQSNLYQQQILQRQQQGGMAPPPQQQRAVVSQTPIPINALNPYISRWTIKARVTLKSELRDFARGNYFTCSFIDVTGTEIRSAFFAEAADKFFEIIETGKVYLVSNARVKFATRKGRGGCDFELTIPQHASIVECEDDGTIPSKHYAFVHIANIDHCAKDTVIDVVGICTNVSPLDTASGKERNLTKMTVTLCDDTDKSVRVTMWGEKAVNSVEPLTGVEGHVLAIKDLKVFVSGGGQRAPTRSLTCFNSSTIDVDPPIPDAARLRDWWEQRGGDISNIDCISGPEFGQGGNAGGGPIRNNSFETFSVLTDDLIKDGAVYLTIRGTIVYIRTEMDPWYNACSEDGCNKKVLPENMQWRCTGCGNVNEKCYQRYILNIMARDHTGGCWLSAFDEVGKILLGVEATELAEIKASDPEERDFIKVINSAYFKRYNLRIKAAEQEWQGKKSTKFTLVKATPLDPKIESELLIERIHKYLGQGDAAPPLQMGDPVASMTFD